MDSSPSNTTSSRKALPTASQLVSKSALKASLSVTVPIYSIVAVASLLCLVFFQHYRVFSAVESGKYSLLQAVRLGDIFSVSVQIESIYRATGVAGIQIIDSEANSVVRERINIPQNCVQKNLVRPMSASFCGNGILLHSRYLLESGKSDFPVIVLTMSWFPVGFFWLITGILLMIFLLSSFVLRMKFKSIGDEIVNPIASFTSALSYQDPDNLSLPVPDVFEFLEIKNLYTQYLDFVEKMNRAKALEKEAAVGRVIAQLTHDLRAPLSTFERVLFSNDSEILAMKGSFKTSLNRLYAMIESLRHSEVEGLIKARRVLLNLDIGIDSLQKKSADKSVKLSIKKMASVEANLDLEKFERAWVNIASNALDFAKSEVQLEIEANGSVLILRVIDDGPGVPDEFLPRLFQRGATHGKADGTGLGLAYVRQIMRGHGGDVTYRRENGLTIFECRLPNAIVQEEEQVVENAANLEIQLTQKIVRTVAIYLYPPELSKAVLARISSFESGDFFFTEERDGANVVVSNVEDIMIEVLEQDDQEYMSVAQLNGDETRIVELLRRKFNIC